MAFFPQEKIPSNNLPADELTSQSTEHPQPVCTWSAHGLQPGSLPRPSPRSHTLIASAVGEYFFFGGFIRGYGSSNVHVFSTRDFSATLSQVSGEVPTPRYGHGAALIGTTFLICGGKTGIDESVQDHDSLYFLNLGTSDPFMSSSTPANH